MGVCKAGLESVSDTWPGISGRRRIRSNLIAAGPLHTRAAGGIPDFQRLLDAWESGSPITWDAADPAPVADAVCFLLSDLARAVTGEILHVDGGYHAMAEACGAGSPRRDQSAIATYFVSRYSPIPSKPPSRPKPDCLTPPKGAAGLETTPWLRPTMPVSMPSQTRKARSRSRV